MSQPGAFHPLTYGASAFSISHNGYTLYDGQRATGVWDFANATVTVLNTAPVPEPSAWALMIAGFGLTGAMLRRVRRQGRLLAASDERRR